MSKTAPSAHAFRVSELSHSKPTTFEVRPDAAQMREIAAVLDLSGLRKLSFAGDLQGSGAADWRLSAVLGATVVQPCAVTLVPVTTRIDVPVTRLFQRDYEDTDLPEAEMPEDDTVEALGTWIDIEATMIEALDLALPMYPRADGAELGEAVFAAPGTAPMRDEDARPFAGLAALRRGMDAPDDEPD